MKKSFQLVLVFSALALCLVGCQKEESAPAPPATATTNVGQSSGPPPVPRQDLPPAAQEQMSKALNDPNTPPEVKAKIRAQMGGQ